MDEVLKKYPNDVKVVIKNFPLSFHKQARRTAQYCLAAGKQGKYKEMYLAIFNDYRKLKTNVDFPLELAQELGLDIEKFINDANDPSIDAQIQKEIEQMKNAGIPRMSVPNFLVAGREPQGRDINAWSAIIDAELKKNKK